MGLEELDDFVAKFEKAAYADEEVDIRDFLPSKHHPKYLEIVSELIRVDIEFSWKKKAVKSLEHYEKFFPEIAESSENFDQIAFEDYRQHVLAGTEISPTWYQERFGINTYRWPLVLNPTQPFDFSSDSALDDEEFQLTSHRPHHNVSLNETQADLAARIGSRKFASNPTVESILHRRLRNIGLAILVSLAYLAILAWINPIDKVGLFLGNVWLQALNWVCILSSATICIILWSKPRIPLHALRIMEVIIFGSILLELCCGLANDLFVDHELTRPLTEGAHELFHYASSWSLPFFALIVVYGTLVPSSWKRCTIVVCVIAILPLAISTIAASTIHGLSMQFIQSFLAQMIIWMSSAAAIAIYGVRRLEESQDRIARLGRLGKYQLIKPLAAGGMGEVFVADDAVMNRRCAIKIMQSKWSMHPELLARFEREVQVLAGISHANIVQITDFGFTNEGVFYYVMELLDGKTLEQFVQANGPISQDQAIEITMQVAEALEVIHGGGIVHRDIKPSNIFLCDRKYGSNVKLLDFGLIKPLGATGNDSNLTQEGTILGTPAYMSPEQASGVQVDHRSDIYSLAASTYFAVTGQHVFARATAVETLTAHIQTPPPFIGDVSENSVSEELQDLLLRCLSKDPTGRFQTAGELSEKLQSIVKP